MDLHDSEERCKSSETDFSGKAIYTLTAIYYSASRAPGNSPKLRKRVHR
jgi:hypothetical protein